MVSVAIVAGALLYVTRVYSNAGEIVRRSQALFEYGLLLEGRMFEYEEKCSIKEKEDGGDLEGNQDYFWKLSAKLLTREDPNATPGIDNVTLDIYRHKKGTGREQYSVVTYLKNE